MTVAKSGSVAGASGKPNVDPYRKLLLRRELLTHAPPGAVYAPYIGDGDLAAELYAGRLILGADLDPARVATAAARLPGSDVRVADCEGPYPFADRPEPVAIADLDAYSNPYLALVAFWSTAARTEPVVIFGTDGMRLATRQSRSRMVGPLPEGKLLEAASLAEKRAAYNGHWLRLVVPFLEATVAPWSLGRVVKYQREAHMVYWGVIVEPPRVAKSRAPGWRKPGETKRQTSAHYRAQVAKRVKKRAAKLRPLTKPERLAVLEAGGWTCWICEKPIDRELRWPDRLSPSVDHRTPVEAGGTNDPENLAPAHLGCNGRKRSSIDSRVTDVLAAAVVAGQEAADGLASALGDIAKVEAALREAALSGNVPAALAWLEANAPERWGERQTAGMSSAERAEALGYSDDGS